MLPAVVVMGAMGVLLLVIVCANVAGLVLVRGVSRRGELAMRLALGASSGRVLRLLLVENLVLAVPGAAAGLALVWFGLPLLFSSTSRRRSARAAVLQPGARSLRDRVLGAGRVRQRPRIWFRAGLAGRADRPARRHQRRAVTARRREGPRPRRAWSSCRWRSPCCCWSAPGSSREASTRLVPPTSASTRPTSSRSPWTSSRAATTTPAAGRSSTTSWPPSAPSPVSSRRRWPRITR